MATSDIFTAPTDIRHTYYVPDKAAADRIAGYLANDRLLKPEEHAAIFQITSRAQKKSYIPIDLPGMLARLMRHYTFGPGFDVRALNSTKVADKNIKRIMENNDTTSLLREVSESLPVLGDGVIRVGLVDPVVVGSDETKRQARFLYVKPHLVHVELDTMDRDQIQEVTVAKLYSTEQLGLGESENQVALLEVHTAGSFEFFARLWDGTKLVGDLLDVEALFDVKAGVQYTGIDEIPFIFIPNNRKAGEFWGRSEFPRISVIVEALERRMAQLDEVLEKHAKPKLIVPPGVLDDKGRIALEHFDVIEVDRSMVEQAIKPEYLTWDMQIEAIKHQIEKLEEYFFMVTETSPASFGLERDGSQVESARALKFKAHRSVNKVEDLRDPFGDAIKKMLRIAQKLETAGDHKYKVAQVQVLWPDPIVEDDTQEALDYSLLKQNSLVSIHRTVKDLFNLTDDEAEVERARILEDEADFSEAGGGGAAPLGFGPPTVEPLPEGGEAAPAAGLGAELAAEEEAPTGGGIVPGGKV